MEIVLPGDKADELRAGLVYHDVETAAVLLASQTSRPNGAVRLLVREVAWPADSDYAERTPIATQLRPAFVARITKKARQQGLALVFVHSHPGDDRPQFSRVDDEGELALARFLAGRVPGKMHASIVYSNGGVQARELGGNTPGQVISVGLTRNMLSNTRSSPIDEAFDRQVRAYGSHGQQTIQDLRVGIVGLGGTGSVVAQQLAHLGVRNFILVDPDVVEVSNLNRVIATNQEAVGLRKIDVAAANIQSIANHSANVQTIFGDITRTRFARELLDADALFGCTDSHGSRAVLQQVAYQYLIPTIDMGVVIAARAWRITHVYGRVQLLSPGMGCFICSNLLDANQVRRDMMTLYERQQDPYIIGAHEPAPAVISLNSTVASLAITMFLSVFAGTPGQARHLLYNGVGSALRSIQTKREPNCYICSNAGSLAQGDAWEIQARKD